MEKLKSLGHYPTIYQQQKRVYLLNMKYDIIWIMAVTGIIGNQFNGIYFRTFKHG